MMKILNFISNIRKINLNQIPTLFSSKSVNQTSTFFLYLSSQNKNHNFSISCFSLLLFHVCWAENGRYDCLFWQKWERKWGTEENTKYIFRRCVKLWPNFGKEILCLSIYHQHWQSPIWLQILRFIRPQIQYRLQNSMKTIVFLHLLKKTIWIG